MSFLTPLYLVGILAVGLPILLHLVRHQPRNVLFFSSLRFLEHKPPQTNRKNKIEHWLLLMLRAIAVLLLVTAFARPFFKNADLELTTADTKHQTILLIDTSSSMQRGTLWNQALQAADEIIQRADKNQIAIYTFDSRLIAVKPTQESKQDASQLTQQTDRERLTKLTPGWNATNLGLALTEIAALLQQQAISDPTGTLLQNSTIELISDFQAGAQISSLSEFSWPAELKVRLHQLKDEQTSNAGLQLLSLDEQGQATIRIVNAADSQQEQFQVAYQTALSESEQSQQVYVPVGQSRVIRMPAVDAQQPAPQIVLTGDQHDFDNRLFLQPREQAQITIVHYGTPAAGSTESPDYFAKRAFPTTPQRKIEFLTVGPDSPQVLLSVAKIHLMIVSRELSAEETNLVKNYLEQGGVAL
ncbi:MAG: BatA and WFA domain-containing protein, partial [Planctomycetaceae bacterium]|nr:BatA and WFA domain-containing protein [Planctomycetaceae bacterium]